jgi:hypothetical protein
LPDIAAIRGTLMATAVEGPRACGKRGCGNLDVDGAGEFLRCSRCLATFYCSRECQKEDYCKGHSACALKGVQAAADGGPLPAGICKQVTPAAPLLPWRFHVPTPATCTLGTSRPLAFSSTAPGYQRTS